MTHLEAQNHIYSILPKIKELREQYKPLSKFDIRISHIAYECYKMGINMDLIVMPEEEFNELLASTFSLFSL